jgi:hypothetical protein
VSHTIFFSWQSDRPTSVCRNFIERALKDAVSRITADTTVEKASRGDLSVDRDTQDVPGSPPIFDTILTKIEGAIIFVPDLTFAGTRVGGKPTPNPNVLIEYGYALNQHGNERLIGVMNTAYGEPTQENMPFNLGHRRFPIQYTLRRDDPEDVRRTVRAGLSRELESAIRLVFDSEDIQSASESKAAERPRTLLDEVDDYAYELDYQAALSALGHGTGLEMARANVRKIFAQIEAQCALIHDRIELEFEAKAWGQRDVDNFCWVRSGAYGMQIYWRQPYGGTDRDAALLIATFTGPIIFPSEAGRKMAFDEVKKLSAKTFVPYLSRHSEVGWAERKPNMREATFVTNEKLVDASLSEFIQLLKRGATQETRPQRRPPTPNSSWL